MLVVDAFSMCHYSIRRRSKFAIYEYSALFLKKKKKPCDFIDSTSLAFTSLNKSREYCSAYILLGERTFKKRSASKLYVLELVQSISPMPMRYIVQRCNEISFVIAVECGVPERQFYSISQCQTRTSGSSFVDIYHATT